MDPHRLPRMLRDLPRPLAERVQDYLTELTPDQVSAVKGLRTRLALLTESAAGPFLEPAETPAGRSTCVPRCAEIRSSSSA